MAQFEHQLNIEEMIDLVNQYVTINCTLPKVLGNDAIRRIITQRGLRKFYREYKYALMRTYYYVDLLSMYKNKSTDVKFLILPDEIENIRWIYQVNYSDMTNLGYILPRGSVGFGLTSQPYIATINISEWAESIATMSNFIDALQTFEKNTLKFSFDPNSKRFEVQTSFQKNLILEVYAHIPPESLYGDPLFQDWVIGNALMELATVLSFTDMALIGNAKYNTTMIAERGQKMIDAVDEKIKAITNSSFFFNRTR